MKQKWSKLLKKPNKEKEEKLRNDIANEGGLDKKDMLAMILSAYLVVIPVVAVVLLVLWLIIRLFFGF